MSEPTQAARTLTTEALFVLVYEQLRSLAAAHLRAERPDHTLQPTALLHEAYLRLSERGGREWPDLDSFVAAAATAVRRALVDHARARNAAKRVHKRRRIPLWDIPELAAPSLDRLIELDEALARLELENARWGRVVELRVFGGMTNDRIANALGIARSTVASDWAGARAWLTRSLSGEMR